MRRKSSKTSIETIIEEDDVESLRFLSNQPNFDFNQKIQKQNELYRYKEIPIILFYIEKRATKCFKFLLLNGSSPLEEATRFSRPGKSVTIAEGGDGMTIAAETGNPQTMEMIEEKGGKIDKNVIMGAAKFHQNHILKWILSKGGNTQDLPFGLFEAARFNNFEGATLLLEAGVDINVKDDFGNTPLHHVARYSTQKMIKF